EKQQNFLRNSSINLVKTSTTTNNDVLNDIQFSKPVIESNIDLSAISEFISMDSTFSPGTSVTAHVEVDQLLALIEEQKANIDSILDSQHVYAVGVDFKKGYSKPCIACWVTENLDIAIKKQLLGLFQDKFEIIENIVTSTDTDVSNSNNDQNSLLNCNSFTKELDNNITVGSFSGNEKESDVMESDEKEDDNSYKENDEKNGDGTIRSKSQAVSKENPKIFQNFDIRAVIYANITPKKDSKILEFSVNIEECEMGRMLSERISSLHKFGFGYFLDSIVVDVSPIPCNSTSCMIIKKIDTQPQQYNQTIKISTIHEKNKGIKGKFSGTGIQVGGSYDTKNALIIEKMACVWEMKLEGCWATGNRWSYSHEGSSYTSTFIPGNHTGKWKISNAMNGFTIEITQVVAFEFTFKGLVMNKTKLIKQCPKMAHILKISFNNIDNFENYFAKLEEDQFEQKDLIFTLNNEDSKNFHKEDTQEQEGVNDYMVTRKFLKKSN
ncbi:14115_t:CDS:2, partial [Dentiscutata heterogama]